MKLTDFIRINRTLYIRNCSQIENVGDVGLRALGAYIDVSNKLNVEMHSFESAKSESPASRREEKFVNFSRELAQQAQSERV